MLEQLTFQVIIHLQMCARDKGGREKVAWVG